MADGTAWILWLTTSGLLLTSTNDDSLALFLSLQSIYCITGISVVHYAPAVIANALNMLHYDSVNV